MVECRDFGVMPNGCKVYSYKLTNKSGASVKILNLGGIIAEINIPDSKGAFSDVVCGFDSVEGYLNGGGYQGALIGRYANRISDGKFTLNGTEYKLFKNENGAIHLHGGKEGFNAKIWDVKGVSSKDSDTLILNYKSVDGEEGYPGNLDVTVEYTFDSDSALTLRYIAKSDKDTVCSMTNHSYFNLSGFASCDINTHTMWLDSDIYTECDENLLPIKNVSVEGTKFDFRVPKKITDDYDHNFMLNIDDGKITRVAELYDEASGRCIELFTDLPAIQFYTANFMNWDVLFKNGVKQVPHTAVCLETQFVPDSPNHPEFPSTVLHAGETYDHTTIFKFGIKSYKSTKF